MSESSKPHDSDPSKGANVPFDDIARQMPELSVAAQNIVSGINPSNAQDSLSGLPRPDIPIDTRTLAHQTFIEANRHKEPPQ